MGGRRSCAVSRLLLFAAPALPSPPLAPLVQFLETPLLSAPRSVVPRPQVAWKGEELWLETPLSHFCKRGVARKHVGGWRPRLSRSYPRQMPAGDSWLLSPPRKTGEPSVEAGPLVSPPLGSSRYPVRWAEVENCTQVKHHSGGLARVCLLLVSAMRQGFHALPASSNLVSFFCGRGEIENARGSSIPAPPPQPPCCSRARSLVSSRA